MSNIRDSLSPSPISPPSLSPTPSPSPSPSLSPSPTRSSSVLAITNLLSPISAQPKHVKPKRKRASPDQLSVLNHVSNTTLFPSTEQRIELGKQLGMTPRAVQIWFQNKRQAIRNKHVLLSRSMSLPIVSTPSPPLSPQSADKLVHMPFNSLPSSPMSITKPPHACMPKMSWIHFTSPTSIKTHSSRRPY